jgi:hypothetical protein
MVPGEAFVICIKSKCKISSRVGSCVKVTHAFPGDAAGFLHML